MVPVFSQNLLSWRLFRGLTQAQLAEKSGIPRPNLVSIEQGRRECTLTTLGKLSHALGLTPGTLLDKSPQEVRLDRYQVDQIARSLFTNEEIPSCLVAIRDHALLQARPLLKVAGIKNLKRISREKINLDSELLCQILTRIRKLVLPALQGSL